MLDEKVIIKVFNDRFAEVSGSQHPDPEFGPEIFLRRRIINIRTVPTKSHNPEYLQVYDFEDGESLVIGKEGRGDDYLYHCFLINNRGNDQYAEGHYLFDGNAIDDLSRRPN